jgi:hypothetical protein
LLSRLRSGLESEAQSDRALALAVVGKLAVIVRGLRDEITFFSELADEHWTIAGKNVRFRKARPVPQRISDTFDADFQREYPQLAVAVGGVLPLLDERSMLSEWMGGAGNPGQLERYAVTGN